MLRDRVLPALIGLLIGAFIGALIGLIDGWPITGLLAGASVGVVLVLLRDALHARRLMGWLRGHQSFSAPRDTGFWGEVAYRIEREIPQGRSRRRGRAATAGAVSVGHRRIALAA